MKPLNNSLQCLFLAVIFWACNTPAPAVNNNSQTHNSQNSIDWEGSYSGILPCADCEGIHTTIELNRDNTYTMYSRYLGKSQDVISSNGKLSWSPSGSIISMARNGNHDAVSFAVGEGKITQLDKNQQPITGNLAAMYILKKIDADILNKYWKLVEVNGKPVISSENMRREPHMILRAAEKRLNGHSGCNSFTGSFEIRENNRIKFSQVASTKMACIDMSTEDLYMKALQSADSYHVSGDSLQLFRARMAPLAKFVAVYLK